MADIIAISVDTGIQKLLASTKSSLIAKSHQIVVVLLLEEISSHYTAHQLPPLASDVLNRG